uniref:Uncharacterized protein n=1 Tax=Anas platyrhynchos platyrhynchos TaxID=8840 RepID=A0A493TDS2_ANAPP
SSLLACFLGPCGCCAESPFSASFQVWLCYHAEIAQQSHGGEAVGAALDQELLVWGAVEEDASQLFLRFVPGPLPGMPQSIPVPVLGCRGGHSPFTTAPSCRKRARTRTGAGHGPMAAVGSLRPGRGARQGWDSLLCPVWGRGEGGKEGEKEGVSAA